MKTMKTNHTPKKRFLTSQVSVRVDGKPSPSYRKASCTTRAAIQLLVIVCVSGPMAWLCWADRARAEESSSSPFSESPTECRAIESDDQRLKCYDGEAKQGAESTKEAAPSSQSQTTEPSLMGIRWELDPGTQQGLFSIRPHKQSYLLAARYTTDVNNQPSSPTQGTVPQSLGYINTEVKFQFSFKLKAVEVKDRFDLWLGYTQLSFFQMYNKSISAPFRENNYEPEIMGVFHTNYSLFGLKGRFINLGLVHQSNGRQDPLSRSWNRIYAQFGFERGGFGLMVRPWYRIREDWTSDNNPDITNYMGVGDIVATYAIGGHFFSLVLRSNLNFWNFHGAAQVDWSFPLYRQLKGYVQAFTGYGESLIDYNHYQTTVGAGFLLFNWM
jgi:phospholipase A1